MMMSTEALAQMWAEYVSALCADLERGLASLGREADPQADADLVALLAKLDQM